MNCILFLLFSLFSFSYAWSANEVGYIDIHYGYLSKNQKIILDRRLIKQGIESKKLAAQGIKIRHIRESESMDLTQSLIDPMVLGIIWIGHPGLIFEPKSQENEEPPKILNSFLLTASQRHLPKGILSARHQNLQFIGWVTCHMDAVIPEYTSQIDSNSLKIYRPNDSDKKSHQSIDNPIIQLTALTHGSEDVLHQIESHKFKMMSQITLPEKKAELIIEYRDLLSKKFDYEIFLNEKFIGSINSENSRVPGQKVSSSIFIFDEIPPGSRLVIRPDDSDRPIVDSKKPIDDILVDQIVLKTENQKITALLKEPVHIGDDSNNWDREIGLSAMFNWKDFQLYPPVSELVVSVDFNFQKEIK